MNERTAIKNHRGRAVAWVEPLRGIAWLGVSPRVWLETNNISPAILHLSTDVARDLGAALIAAADRAEAMPDQQRPDDQEVTP